MSHSPFFGIFDQSLLFFLTWVRGSNFFILGLTLCVNDLKFVTHFSISIMENIIRKTVQVEVEKRESPQESKLKKVHIKWKRFCIVRNAEYLVPPKKGGSFKFIHLALEATVEDLKKKATEVFFPDSVNHSGKKADECLLTLTDAGDNIVTAEMSIKDYLHKKGLYL